MSICKKCLELVHEQFMTILYEIAAKQLDDRIYYSENKQKIGWRRGNNSRPWRKLRNVTQTKKLEGT